VLELVFFFTAKNNTPIKFHLLIHAYSLFIVVIWFVMKRKPTYEARTSLLAVPFLVVTLVLTVLASKDCLPDSFKEESENLFFFQVVVLYIIASCLNYYDFRLNLYLFSPMTLVASFLVANDQMYWFEKLYSRVPAEFNTSLSFEPK